MNERNDPTSRCRIHHSALAFTQCAGLTGNPGDNRLEGSVIESARQLMALGLSMEEIEELDIRQPMLQAILEYAELDRGSTGRSEQAAEAVQATLRVVADEMQKLDMEMEMLSLRKRALARRTQVLRKIAVSLESGDSGLLAA